jgi:hypothetical protein
MVGEAIGIGLCLLLWGAKAYLATRYVIKFRIAGEERWAWKRGTPDWVTLAMPWLQFLSWVVLLGLIAWWVFHAVRGIAAIALATSFSPGIAPRCPSFA